MDQAPFPTTDNPLLTASTLPHAAAPFDRIEAGHFMPALEEAIEDARRRLDAITSESAPPSFENSIVALENATEEVDRIAGLFYVLLGAERTDALQALADKVGPKVAAFQNDILLDEALFARVKTVHDGTDATALRPDQRKLLEDFYETFVRNGALLNANEKGELRAIDERLSKLGPAFTENILKDTNAFALFIEDEADLGGLPESAVSAAAEAATAKGREGSWAFTLDIPSYLPFLKFADSRELRETLWRAYATRATEGATDNRPLIAERVGLRHRRARLLGFDTHAGFVLQRRMAESPERVRTFLDEIAAAARPAAERDLSELQDLSRELGGPDPLMPWDFSYYAEKLKQRRFDFESEALRPYFALGRVLEGVFEHARRLYGVTFQPTTALPVYHPDVQVFEVREEEEDRFVGLLYGDFFPRPGKRAGAWMTVVREQSGPERPHIAIVCNFSKPSRLKPSLLTFDEVSTLFHEMGHALHGLLSDCAYRSQAGTNVLWDFVELPSQIFENWIQEKESLDLFARHHETDEPIPEELARKIKESAKFLAGTQALRQVSLGQLDLAWHDRDPAGIGSVDSFEDKVTEPFRLLPKVDGAMTSPSFNHIFAGGYAAGYYSYKWAEVLDADAFELFLERGLFDRETARRFRTEILSKGGSEPPMDLYRRFRGREPDPKAMLRRDGLI
ncbi:M3 family metallopeptidase [Inquilinus sp. CAU 1745]|uniref:M3 family metallopeptidase n=1 Tax=Inquilinus sp. CAU 1745 TaxID=3140369 RepID=UPI00325BFE63